MKAFIYFNLHKKCWSIKALEDVPARGIRKGRVIGHASEAVLLDVRLQVSEAGRQRVLRTKRKNVHAGVVGELIMWFGQDDNTVAYVGNLDGTKWFQATYNPYKAATFTRVGTGEPEYSARVAWLLPRKLLLRN